MLTLATQVSPFPACMGIIAYSIFVEMCLHETFLGLFLDSFYLSSSVRSLFLMQVICLLMSVLKGLHQLKCLYPKTWNTSVVDKWNLLKNSAPFVTNDIPAISRRANCLRETWRWLSSAGSASMCLTRDETQFLSDRAQCLQRFQFISFISHSPSGLFKLQLKSLLPHTQSKAISYANNTI